MFSWAKIFAALHTVVKSNYWRLAPWMLLLCSLLAMIYKWESICYNWVSSRLTSLIFCCSSASPHPCLASSEAEFLALCDNWIKIFFWQPEYCSVAFLSTAHLCYSFHGFTQHFAQFKLYHDDRFYLSENLKGFGKTMNALLVDRFVFNIM